MPHCILEYTDNVPDQLNAHPFFKELHALMINNGPFVLEQIKSRVIKHSNYFVGTGDKSKGFIFLQIGILSGRPLEIRQKVSGAALALLEKTFPLARRSKEISMTVEVREIDKESHSRLVRE